MDSETEWRTGQVDSVEALDALGRDRGSPLKRKGKGEFSSVVTECLVD